VREHVRQITFQVNCVNAKYTPRCFMMENRKYKAHAVRRNSDDSLTEDLLERKHKAKMNMSR